MRFPQHILQQQCCLRRKAEMASRAWSVMFALRWPLFWKHLCELRHLCDLSMYHDDDVMRDMIRDTSHLA